MFKMRYAGRNLKMKRITALILTVLIVALTAACASSEQASEESFDADFSVSSDGNTNFGGIAFTVATMSNKLPTTSTELLGFSRDSTFGDELLTRIAETESKNNCTISFKDGGFDLDDAKYALFSGDHFADLLFGEYNTARKWGPTGLLLPIDEYMDVIDITDSFRWGGRNIFEGNMIGGVIYGVSPMCWPGNFGGYVFVIMSNNDLLLQNGFSHPYDYLENGQWTADKMTEISSGVYDKDRGIYGIAYNGWFYRMCIVANGVRFVEKNSAGEYENGYITQRAINAVQWARDFYRDLKDYSVPQNGWNYDEANFNSGRAGFVLMISNDIIKFTYNNSAMSDFSALPFPNGPDVEYGDWTGYLNYESNSVFIPCTEINIPEAATLEDILLRPFSGSETQEDLFDFYTKNVFMDSRDVRYLFKAVGNSYYSDNMLDLIDGVCNEAGTKSAAEACRTVAPKSENLLKSDVIPNLEGLIRYFGE